MTKAEIITKFELFMDDGTELSTQESSDLFDKMYRQINSDRPWEGTKTEATAYTNTFNATVTLEADFLYPVANSNYSDSSEYSQGPVVYVGNSFRPYKVVSWSDRRSYRNQDGFCWFEYANLGSGLLVFAKQPASVEPIEYDYHYAPASMDIDDTPWFPAEFHDMIYHMMCADDYVIQQSDKAKSYKSENERIVKDYMERMVYWNSQLVQI